MKRIILHCFNWNLTDIKNNLQNIKDSGFNFIQISPIQKCKEGNDWWRLYQPLGYEIGNHLGLKEDFINLCTEAKKYNIGIIVDVVLRHLASDDNDCTKFHPNCDENLKKYRLNTYQGKDCDGNRWECTHCDWGMPTLNYFNPELQDIQINFLKEIANYGCSCRLDQMKHISLPSEGCSLLKRIHDELPNMYIYGEAINTASQHLDEYIQYADVLIDKYHSFNCHNNTVRFFESHDTHFEFKSTTWMRDDQRLYEWGNMLSRYNNCLYFARPWDSTIFSDNMKWINSNAHEV